MAEVSSPSPPDRPIDTRSAVVVLVTWPADRDAADVARLLVEEGLAACVNVSAEMTSTYRWHGEVSVDRERQLVLKTVRDKVAAIEARMAALHPYEVPEFLVFEADDGSDAYVAWVRQCTRT